MENMFSTAIKISSIGIVVLLLVLAALAVIVYLMTRFIVDKEDKEETLEQETVQPAAEIMEPRSDLKLAAAVAVAIARSRADTQSVTIETSAEGVNPWRLFGLQRRLNQSSTIRRAR
jgi:Na+-transporting methylmalonyl-CoA/oxaloacetate decarboxylase gamma subunit